MEIKSFLSQVYNQFKRNRLLTAILALGVVLLVWYLVSKKSVSDNLPIVDDTQDMVGGTQASPMVGGDYQANQLVLVYADWCGHCQALKPTWEQLEGKLNGKTVNGKKLVVKRVNGDENKEVAQTYNVKGYPSIFMVKENGDVVEYKGDRSLDSLEKFVDESV